MTVKNGIPWIADAIESILKQTITSWELVIVDDGSSDDTPRLLQHFAQNDERIRVILTEGVGRGPALNLALKHTRASYVANLDADDLWHPKRLEIALNVLQKHPSFSLVATEGIVFANHQKIAWPAYQENDVSVFDITHQLMLSNPILHSSVIISRSAIMAVGGYDENLKDNLDYDLWVRLFISGFRLGFINLSLIGKRIHPHQSFEARQHLRYVLSGTRIQYRAIRHGSASMPFKLKAWVFLFLRIGWGLLPQRIRLHLAKRRQQFILAARPTSCSR